MTIRGVGRRGEKKRGGSRTHVSLVVAMQDGDGVVDRRGWGSGKPGSTRTDEEEKIWGRGWQVVLSRSKDTVTPWKREELGHDCKRVERGDKTGFEVRRGGSEGSSTRRRSASRFESIKQTQLML